MSHQVTHVMTIIRKVRLEIIDLHWGSLEGLGQEHGNFEEEDIVIFLMPLRCLQKI